MKRTLLTLILLTLFSCFQEPTQAPQETKNDGGWEIVIETPLRYTYRFYRDSLFTELVPLADGSYPGNSIITDKSAHPKYRREDIPDPAWVLRTDIQVGVIGQWKVVGDSLVSASGESVEMEWEVVE